MVLAGVGSSRDKCGSSVWCDGGPGSDGGEGGSSGGTTAGALCGWWRCCLPTTEPLPRCVCVCAAVYGGSAAFFGGSTTVYGGSTAVFGCSTTVYGGSTAVFEGSASSVLATTNAHRGMLKHRHRWRRC
eukprot:671170-Rhodomonas_salina.1